LKKIKPHQLLKVAYVSKAHGIKGEVFARSLNNPKNWPCPIKEIIVGESVFSVQRYSFHKDGVIFKLQNCETRLSAEDLKAQPVFLPKKLFKSTKGETIYLAELLFFYVAVSGYGRIGQVQSFQSCKHQDFLVVEQKENRSEILIPLVKDYIQDICFSQRTLTLNLPKNFLEIFVG